MHIHTSDKRVLCKSQMPFYSFVLLWKPKAYNADNMPEEIWKTPLTGSQLKALIGDMSLGEGSSGGGIKIHRGFATQ